MTGKGSSIYLICKIFDLYITLTTTFFNLYFTCTIKNLISNVNRINQILNVISRPIDHEPQDETFLLRKLINGREEGDQINVGICNTQLLPEPVTGRLEGTDSLAGKFCNILG